MSDDAQITNPAGVPPSPQRRRPRPPESHKATRRTVELADELAALLTIRPAVLVSEVGEPVRPLKVGARGELIALMRPDLAHHHLHRALRRYARAVPYLLACLKDGAMRHDLETAPRWSQSPKSTANSPALTWPSVTASGPSSATPVRHPLAMQALLPSDRCGVHVPSVPTRRFRSAASIHGSLGSASWQSLAPLRAPA